MSVNTHDSADQTCLPEQLVRSTVTMCNQPWHQWSPHTFGVIPSSAAAYIFTINTPKPATGQYPGHGSKTQTITCLSWPWRSNEFIWSSSSECLIPTDHCYSFKDSIHFSYLQDLNLCYLNFQLPFWAMISCYFVNYVFLASLLGFEF